jgi:hypothetical protein
MAISSSVRGSAALRSVSHRSAHKQTETLTVVNKLLSSDALFLKPLRRIFWSLRLADGGNNTIQALRKFALDCKHMYDNDNKIPCERPVPGLAKQIIPAGRTGSHC